MMPSCRYGSVCFVCLIYHCFTLLQSLLTMFCFWVLVFITTRPGDSAMLRRSVVFPRDYLLQHFYAVVFNVHTVLRMLFCCITASYFANVWGPCICDCAVLSSCNSGNCVSWPQSCGYTVSILTVIMAVMVGLVFCNHGIALLWCNTVTTVTVIFSVLQFQQMLTYHVMLASSAFQWYISMYSDLQRITALSAFIISGTWTNQRSVIRFVVFSTAECIPLVFHRI